MPGLSRVYVAGSAPVMAALWATGPALRASPEEVWQRGAAFVGRESVSLVDPHPRQLLASSRQLVAAPRQLLFRHEQLEPRGHPFFASASSMCRHRPSPFVGCRSSVDS